MDGWMAGWMDGWMDGSTVVLDQSNNDRIIGELIRSKADILLQLFVE